MKKIKFAFTLAEVLIAITIIGVVAAITVPIGIVNYRKVSVPAKLEKFYSISNNALRLWYVESGNYAGTYEFTEEYYRNGPKTKEFYDSTIGKYLVGAKESTISEYGICTALNDGSGFCGYINNTLRQLYFFYCTEYKYCRMESFDGKNTFLFTLDLKKGKVVTSTSSFDNKTRNQLLYNCKYGNSDNSETSSKGRRHACARLIEVDGWMIKDDYPWLQSIL